MDKTQVVGVLQEIAAMLELAGENPFKVRAYENAAEAIAGFPGDLARAVESGRLRELRGVGDAIFGNVQTLVNDEPLPVYRELLARFPPSLRDCLRLPGLGAKKVRLLHDRLGIDSLESLERACLEGRLAQVQGFGPRSVERILRGVAALRSGRGWHRLDRAAPRAQALRGVIRETGMAGAIEIAGSLRRRREIVRDIDLVVQTPQPEALRSAIPTLPGVLAVEEQTPSLVRVRLAGGMAADVMIVADPQQFGAALLTATGSSAHLRALAAWASEKGLSLEAPGLPSWGATDRTAGRGESEIYAALGLPFIPPELREGTGEIEAAARGTLPRLVEREDLRGLIHAHTNESDGRASLETMVSAAHQAGYAYLAVTDHSQAAAYAHGLTPERVLAQREAIRRLAGAHPGFRIFHGTEADILADGSIDFGDEFLEGFDLVVASVHSRFGLSSPEQTRRLVRAVRNSRVSILGHPSGRLLLSREPLEADWEAVLAAAADSGCAIEINCNPERLELDWRLCRQAAEAGILLSIDPDAHSVAEMGWVELGLGVARKGWLTADSILNTKTAEELQEWLVRRRGKPLPA